MRLIGKIALSALIYVMCVMVCIAVAGAIACAIDLITSWCIGLPAEAIGVFFCTVMVAIMVCGGTVSVYSVLFEDR